MKKFDFSCLFQWGFAVFVLPVVLSFILIVPFGFLFSAFSVSVDHGKFLNHNLRLLICLYGICSVLSFNFFVDSEF